MHSEDPEGAAQDVQRFSTEPRKEIDKHISQQPSTRAAAHCDESPSELVGGAVTFLWALSKKSDSPTAKAFKARELKRRNDAPAFAWITSTR
jgi:hypothetical protein